MAQMLSQIASGKPNEGPQVAPRRHAPLETARRAHAKQGAHAKAEIQRRCVEQRAFADVHVTPEVHAPHSARFVEMRKRSFQSFAAQPEQALPARAANPSTIPVDGIARLRTIFPVAPPAIRFGDVAADSHGLAIRGVVRARACLSLSSKKDSTLLPLVEEEKTK